jgi:flagellar M-ring protein FliF
MPDWLSNLLNDIRGIWEKLPTSQKWLVGGISTALLVGLIAITLALYAFPSPQLLVGDVPQGERGPIIRYLRDQGIRYEVDNAGDIYVHGNAEDLYWDYAAQQPEGTLGGYSWLLDSNWGMTRDQFNEASLRAHQEVLAKAIVNGNPKILTAKVFLAPGEEGLFPSTSTKPTASVSVTTRGNVERGIVEGIQVLVAGSMPGLEPQEVVVLGDGRPLEGFHQQTETERLTTEQQRAQAVEEEKRRKAISRILDPIVGGTANYTSTVIVDLDFDQVEISEVVTDTQEPLEKKISTMETEETSRSGGAVPGTPPNLAGDTLGEDAGSGQVTESTQLTEEIEHTPRRVTETQKKLAPGKLLKQSVSITVNYKNDPSADEWVPRTAEEMTQLEQTLKAAVGHIEDSTAYTFALSQTTFDTTADRLVIAQARKESFRRNLESGAFLIAGLILIGVFFYFLKKVFSIPPEEREILVEEEVEPPPHEFSLSELGLRALGEVEGLAPDAQKSRMIREQIEEYATDNPEMVAGILKGWISE